MKFNFNNGNDDGIKRVIGRNFSTQQEDQSSELIKEEKTEQQTKESKTYINEKRNPLSEDNTPFYKKINLIPFVVFILFSIIVFSQRDNLIPTHVSHNYQNVAQQETTITNENNKEQLKEEVAQENVETEQVKEEETKNVKEESTGMRTELAERVNAQPQQTSQKVATTTQPKISREEQLQIAEAYKNQFVNIVRQNWHPSNEEPEGGDATVVYEITVDKLGINKKLTKGVITATINNRAFDAIYDSFNQIPVYPKELGSTILRFNIIFNRSSISSSKIMLADRIEDLPYTKEYQLF